MSAYAGQTIGSLVLRHKLADGGMGSVWVAEHVTLHREVAVKFLLKSPLGDQDSSERFALEARTIARISSPHVPQVFDHGVGPDGAPYMVMELVLGTDLKSWVAARGPMSLPHAVRLVEQVSLAMKAAHELGIVHRDIKPENLLLTGDGDDFHVKLVDFGIAKSTGLALSSPSLTRAGVMMGTPSYMSPEQLLSPSDVDERSDLWSLAVVTYWALTGVLPFDGETFAAVCVAISRGHYTPVTERRPDLPSELDRWFDRGLARDVGERFQSAELMSGMLRVAASRPNPGTQATAVLTSGASAKARVLPVSAMAILEAAPNLDPSYGGVSRTSQALRPLERRRVRHTVTYALSGLALGLAVFAGIELWPSRAAGRVAAASVVAPDNGAVRAPADVTASVPAPPTTGIPAPAPVPESTLPSSAPGVGASVPESSVQAAANATAAPGGQVLQVPAVPVATTAAPASDSPHDVRFGPPPTWARPAAHARAAEKPATDSVAPPALAKSNADSASDNAAPVSPPPDPAASHANDSFGEP